MTLSLSILPLYISCLGLAQEHCDKTSWGHCDIEARLSVCNADEEPAQHGMR